MRIRAILILSLVIGITLVSYFFALFEVRADQRSLRQDLSRRAQIFAESLQETIEPLLPSRSHRALQRIVDRFGNRERLAGVAVYNNQKDLLAMTPGLMQKLKSRPQCVDLAIGSNQASELFLHLGNSLMHVYALPLHQEGAVAGALAIFDDANYIEAQSNRVWRETFLHILVQVLLIALITIFIVRWMMVGRIARMAKWMQDLRAGKPTTQPQFPEQDLFKPLTREVTHMARSLIAARNAADQEARLREAAESHWTPERLRIHVQGRLGSSRLFAISNREPYVHERRGNKIEVQVPASGLVTALEPILRACDGTWIAHGSGSADREAVDRHDRLRVPPNDARQYTLRRVWLTPEEEQGYYYGFANEGLWPLCHIAHTRPVFRAEDWEFYQQANQKFAETTVEEMKGNELPVVLVQDYHFALLPRLIKDIVPQARVAIFWHIPWPNPEAFGICPWQRELVRGLLGADLVGFHIQSHCNNFLETVDRVMESQVDWERFGVNRRGHWTLVRPFPISVDMTDDGGIGPDGRPKESVFLDRPALFKELGVEATFMGIGVDRVDYTKGILERFRGVERFLEKRIAYRGKFTFIQIGAPSRTRIPRYHNLLKDVEAEAERINARFQAGGWKPIVFLNRHHTHKEIERYYRAADVCMVTSLHDGMNLVAKEFVAARDDGGGALILSRFTGAARELTDALVVNPYDTEGVADAIYLALEMEPEDRRTRMHRMRQCVREHNIYRWAANLVTELSEIRVEAPKESLRT
ncbi:MAG TPA: trehalose-6-phosphate synthase [Terriglobia bacterium]|nr:trehalose-6-phosphate synthase [Terriglobia bacterium]